MVFHQAHSLHQRCSPTLIYAPSNFCKKSLSLAVSMPSAAKRIMAVLTAVLAFLRAHIYFGASSNCPRARSFPRFFKENLSPQYQQHIFSMRIEVLSFEKMYCALPQVKHIAYEFIQSGSGPVFYCIAPNLGSLFVSKTGVYLLLLLSSVLYFQDIDSCISFCCCSFPYSCLWRTW